MTELLRIRLKVIQSMLYTVAVMIMLLSNTGVNSTAAYGQHQMNNNSSSLLQKQQIL